MNFCLPRVRLNTNGSLCLGGRVHRFPRRFLLRSRTNCAHRLSEVFGCFERIGLPLFLSSVLGRWISFSSSGYRLPVLPPNSAASFARRLDCQQFCGLAPAELQSLPADLRGPASKPRASVENFFAFVIRSPLLASASFRCTPHAAASAFIARASADEGLFLPGFRNSSLAARRGPAPSFPLAASAAAPAIHRAVLPAPSVRNAATRIRRLPTPY